MVITLSNRQIYLLTFDDGFGSAPSGLSCTPLFSRRKYWAARFSVTPFLPMSRAEMDTLEWDSCDIIIVTGDVYVDLDIADKQRLITVWYRVRGQGVVIGGHC
ncbi:MAG: hypothetical protein HC889_12465 [Synechococcaceae cyanobacterium SM1_2_3]|nr:hypothetical protein [Synechococcaceae cyanobacterium SM1_2_3]